MYDEARCTKKFAKNKEILKDQSVREFLNNKKILNDRYLTEKSGDIQTYLDQTKLLALLIKSQQEASKATQDKIVASQDLTNNALVPFTTELKRRNNQVEAL